MQTPNAHIESHATSSVVAIAMALLWAPIAPAAGGRVVTAAHALASQYEPGNSAQYIWLQHAVHQRLDEAPREFSARAMALALLGLMAEDGSLVRVDAAAACGRLAQSLLAAMDSRGRIALAGEPTWLEDHAIATYALCELWRLAGDRAGEIDEPDRVHAAVSALGSGIERHRPVAPAALAWAALVVDSLELGEREPSSGRGAAATAGRQLATVLRAVPVEAPAAAEARFFVAWRTGGAIAVDAALDGDSFSQPIGLVFRNVVLRGIDEAAWGRRSCAAGSGSMPRRIGPSRWGRVWEVPRDCQQGDIEYHASRLLLVTLVQRYCKLSLYTVHLRFCHGR